MGYQVEFNWVLKLKPDQGLDEAGLEEGRHYRFRKKGNRIYPVGIEIYLINEDWVCVGKAVITEATNTENKTEGMYVVRKIFDEKKRYKVKME